MRLGFDIDQVVFEIPGDICVTAEDASEHPVVGELAQSRSEVVALALWLMAERSNESSSPWHPYIKSLPVRICIELHCESLVTSAWASRRSADA